MKNEHSETLNAKAVRIKSAEEFKEWLSTIEPRYRASVQSHRRTYTAILRGSKNKEVANR